MKIRIIADDSPFKKSVSIEQFIGQIFVVDKQNADKSIEVYFDHDIRFMTVFPNEYEIIDIATELKEFVEARCGIYGLEPTYVTDFILEHKNELVRILK